MFRASLRDSSVLSAVRLIVEHRASGWLLSLLVPDPRIDGGVQEIGKQVGEDDPDDDDCDCFIHQDSWRASEKLVSRHSRTCPSLRSTECCNARAEPKHAMGRVA